jgi:hypothetical protein
MKYKLILNHKKYWNVILTINYIQMENKTVLYQLTKNLIGLKVQLLNMNCKPTMTTVQNWSNLSTLDYTITLTKSYLLFCIIITCWKFQN